MSRLAAGKMEILGQLYVEHAAMVRRALRRFAPKLTEAELDEHGQEVFLQLYKSAGNFPKGVSLKTWLYAIAANTARNAGRKSWIRVKLLGQFNGPPPLLSRPNRTSMDAEIENRDMVQKALALLPQAQREVLMLYAVDGFNGEEIAQILGVKIQTVWTRLHRARQTIQKEMRALFREETSRMERALLYQRDS